MKKILLILFTAIVIGLFIFGISQQFLVISSKKGALQVTASPEVKVYLNDKHIGNTPLCKCEGEDILKAGEYTIKLVPTDKNLAEYQEKIVISDGVLTVIDRKFGNDSESSGSVISLSPLPDKKATELLVVSIPSKANIHLDNNEIGQTPFLFKNPSESDHTLRVSKEGYSDKTVRIRTPLGYKLSVIMYLSTGAVGSEVIVPVASKSAAITPSAPSSKKVTILDTPTGFLRVRESASITAPEIGRVTPAEEYELIGEQTGWFQIKLKDGKTGWISSQYAQKQ